MDELISVIVPIYKVETYLRRCLDSIINQTYRNLEIILVDDGSPDLCPGICDEYARRDERIKVIHKENGGLSSARNAGIEIMTGKFVTFVDSDDFLDAGALERWLEAAVRNNVDLVIGNFADYYDGDEICKRGNEQEDLWSAEEAIKKMLLENDRLCVAWGKLYKSDLFIQLRYPEDIKFAEDMYVIHKLFHMAQKIIYSHPVSYYYNQEGTSLVRSKFNIQKLNRVKAALEWLNFVDGHYKKLHDAAIAYCGIVVMNECITLFYLKEEAAQNALEHYYHFLQSRYAELMKNPYMKKSDRLKLRLIAKKRISIYTTLNKIRRYFRANGKRSR